MLIIAVFVLCVGVVNNGVLITSNNNKESCVFSAVGGDQTKTLCFTNYLPTNATVCLVSCIYNPIQQLYILYSARNVCVILTSVSGYHQTFVSPQDYYTTDGPNCFATAILYNGTSDTGHKKSCDCEMKKLDSLVTGTIITCTCNNVVTTRCRVVL